MYPKDYFSEKQRVRNGQCFVLMPFAPEFTEVYDTIVEALEDPRIGFSCRRADEIFGGGHIIADILRLLAESEVIIADLTSRNPNVFYELGIAHTVKDIEKVLIITQDMNDVPFDLQHFRCITYEQREAGLCQLKRRLADVIRGISRRVYQFTAENNQSFEFSQRLSHDRCFYTFELPEVWVAGDAVKFRLKIIRYAIGHAPKETDVGVMYLEEKDSIQISDLPWRLELEKVEPDRKAFFRVVPE